MSLHHIANHLASKGRNGDTTLVHMTNGEVAGLQALAQRNGTSLTINPHTGLPEAFSLKSLVPMAAGAGLMAMGVPAPIAAGLVGFGAYATTGSLQQGLMAGLGAYGGASLAGGVGAMGAEAGTQAAAGEAAKAGEIAAQEAVKEETAKQVAQQSAQQAAEVGAPGVYAPAANSTPVMTPEIAAEEAAQAANKVGMPTYGAPAGVNGTPFTPATQQALANPYEAGLKAAYNNPSAYVDKLGGGMEAAKYGLAAAAPVIADEMAPKPYQAPVIKSDSDMGPRYAYSSGYDNSIPGRTGPASYQRISNEEAKKLYGFAAGGDVQQDPNAQQVPAFDPVVRMASGGSTGGSYVPSYSDVSYGMGPAAGLGSTPQGIAGLGAPVAVNYDVATGYTPEQMAAMNYVSAPKGNPNANIVALYAKIEADRKAAEAAAAAAEAAKKSSFGLGSRFFAGTALENDPAATEPLNSVGNEIPGASSMRLDWRNTNTGAAQGGLMQSYAQGGISSLGSYSDGGRLLKGPGDGMSDNIPAQIGAKQPARLADGEFVVPADVVSHLGNGSTDAGAKQLYKMMDKIRQARTGRKAQGKQINPNKFIPT